MPHSLIFVHGFNYDSRTFGPDHPEYHTYPRWRAMLPDREHVPFKWFSHPSLFDAWRHRRWNQYRRAWDLAEEARGLLVGTIMACRGPVDIVCHSLGSRVTLLALRVLWQGPKNISKVLILNGAEYSHTGEAIANFCPGVKFYNIVVPEDDVLNVAARGAPGFQSRFLGSHGISSSPPNWQDIPLSQGSLSWAWATARNQPTPEGDNPHNVGDHWYTFENETNWPLYRAILSGEWDDWQQRPL